MKKQYLIISLLTIIGLIIICAIPFKSPIQRTFDRAIKSANSHDYVKFCQYVDIKGIMRSYLKVEDKEKGNGFSSPEQAENSDDIERSIEYFIETEQIPDLNRFRRIFSTKIEGENATAMIALDARHYSVICTTSVTLRLLKSGWQLTGIDLEKVWNKVKRAEATKLFSSGQIPEALTLKNMISDIIFDTDNQVSH
jgi:hypothetical protein